MLIAAAAISITVVSANPAKLQLVLAAATTAELAYPNYQWDLFITWPDGKKDKLFYGAAAVLLSVTRPA
jgi:hypothetical protein